MVLAQELSTMNVYGDPRHSNVGTGRASGENIEPEQALSFDSSGGEKRNISQQPESTQTGPIL